MNWTRATCGVQNDRLVSFWTGENGFHISSYWGVYRAGYMLYNGSNMLGLYPSLEEAQEAAEPHVQVEKVEREVRQ